MEPNKGRQPPALGSEDDFSDFSDEDPTFNPEELEAYSSSDDEDCESALPSCSTSFNSRKGRQNDTPATLIAKANDTATNAQNRNKTKMSTNVSSKPEVPKYTWKKRNLFISENDKKFKGNLEYPDKITILETPFQSVKYFLTDELFQKILDESMLYAFQKDPNSVFQITKTDLQRYLGICLLTSVTQNFNVRDFWNNGACEEYNVVK
ncbi:hypothetical protein AVEN_77999-1 [Araneus ventricosus]|uniref:PiggyBac transposable element-derived protein domain-containing protein n=1 Tax=Araneus ventricosus TaxID=182803 RepID=A0A4Y2MEM9_ARAVE|nr:hypothetical protein AVEN_77999-1 [Araneus ventricosus]